MPAPKKDKLQPEPDECYNEGRNWEAKLYPRGEGYWRCGIPGLKYSTERCINDTKDIMCLKIKFDKH